VPSTFPETLPHGDFATNLEEYATTTAEEKVCFNVTTWRHDFDPRNFYRRHSKCTSVLWSVPYDVFKVLTLLTFAFLCVEGVSR
jgi:Iap family predicted aminopeptidase